MKHLEALDTGEWEDEALAGGVAPHAQTDEAAPAVALDGARRDLPAGAEGVEGDGGGGEVVGFDPRGGAEALQQRGEITEEGRADELDRRARSA
jgi:hypothetical protein